MKVKSFEKNARGRSVKATNGNTKISFGRVTNFRSSDAADSHHNDLKTKKTHLFDNSELKIISGRKRE